MSLQRVCVAVSTHTFTFQRLPRSPPSLPLSLGFFNAAVKRDLGLGPDRPRPLLEFLRGDLLCFPVRGTLWWCACLFPYNVPGAWPIGRPRRELSNLILQMASVESWHGRHLSKTGMLLSRYPSLEVGEVARENCLLQGNKAVSSRRSAVAASEPGYWK